MKLKPQMAIGLICVTFIGFATCSISDKDRCPSGYYWEKEYMSCLPDEGEQDASIPIADGGLGTPCTGDEDCADLTANFCAQNPITGEEEGYCSIQGCVADDCPTAWQCCDCSSLGWVVLCLDDAFATQAGGFGCTCE